MVEINDDITPDKNYQVLWFDYVSGETEKMYGEFDNISDALDNATKLYYKFFDTDEGFKNRADLLVVDPQNRRYSIKLGNIYDEDWDKIDDWTKRLEEKILESLYDKYGWVIAEQFENIVFHKKSITEQNKNSLKIISNEVKNINPKLNNRIKKVLEDNE